MNEKSSSWLSGRLVIAFSLLIPNLLSAQNLLSNPELDDFSGGFPGWTSTSVMEREGDDADGCPSSGSFRIQSSGNNSFVTSEVCVPVETNDVLHLELTYRSDVEIYVRVAEYTDSTCGAANLATLGISQPASADWTTVHVVKQINFAETESVRFQPVAHEDELAYVAEFDRAFLGFEERIFADDFDGDADGTFCRWDAVFDGQPL